MQGMLPVTRQESKGLASIGQKLCMITGRRVLQTVKYREECNCHGRSALSALPGPPLYRLPHLKTASGRVRSSRASEDYVDTP